MVFAACVSFVLPVWDTPIDFRPDVASAPTLVRLLADKTGLKLTTNLNVANDIVGIVAPSATPREIMDQLAYTIDAKWIEAGGEWTLVRTPEQFAAQKSKALEDARDRIQKAIDKIVEPKAWTEGDAKVVAQRINEFQKKYNGAGMLGPEYTEIRKAMPAQRLLARFLKVVPVADLASIGTGDRIVYSTAPNKMQRPMPNALKSDIEQFTNESSLLADAWIDSGEGAQFFVAPRRGKVEEVVVSISRTGFGGLTAELRAFDSNDGGLGDASLGVDSSFTDGIKPEKLTDSDKLIELRPLSKQLVAIAQDAMQNKPMNPPEELRQRFYHPKESEPMALVNTEGMQALSSVEKKNVVIAFPEPQIFGVLVLSPDGKITIRRFQQSLTAMGDTREEHDGWICYKERDPIAGRTRRIDRASLENYYKRVERDKRAGLEALAELTLKHPTPLEHTMFPIYVMLTGSYLSNMRYDGDLNLVRLYGTLTGAQKESLKRGDKLGIDAFSNPQKQYLSRFMFSKRYDSLTYEAVDGRGGDIYNGRVQEPTEVFPNGLGGTFALSANVSDRPSLFRKESYGEVRPTTADQLAWEQYQGERPDLFPYASAYLDRQKGTQFISGHENQWEFRIRLTPYASTSAILTDNAIPESGFMSADQLPADFKAEVRKKLDALREQYKNAKPGEFGGRSGSPPPAR